MPLEGALHESLRLYRICKAMKWTHLPVAGGLYDQHPKFLDDMLVILEAEGEHHQRESEKQKRESARKTSGRGASSRGRRR